MNCLTLDRHAAVKRRSKQFCQSSPKCKGLVESRMFGHQHRAATGMAHVQYVATLLNKGRRIAGHPDKFHNSCYHAGKGRNPKAHHFDTVTLRCSHPESRRRHGKQLECTGVPGKGHAQTTATIAKTQCALEGQR